MSNNCTCLPLDLSFIKLTEQPWWISPAKASAIPNSIFVVTPAKTDQPRKVNPNEASDSLKIVLRTFLNITCMFPISIPST